MAENYKQCASCLEYSRNYAKEHPDFKRELTKNWLERNADRMKEYRNEKVECPYCKQEYSRQYFRKHKKLHQQYGHKIEG